MDTTETHEPSYYEVALTNRQVLVAFVVLLSFFASPLTARSSCMLRSASSAPSRCGPSSAARHASTAFIAMSDCIAKCGSTRPTSACLCNGEAVGLGHLSLRVVNASTSSAASALPEAADSAGPPL